jgi:hypothetical protein
MNLQQIGQRIRHVTYDVNLNWLLTGSGEVKVK